MLTTTDNMIALQECGGKYEHRGNKQYFSLSSQFCNILVQSSNHLDHAQSIHSDNSRPTLYRFKLDNVS